MNLGELIERLEKESDQGRICAEGFRRPHSYRGDYRELSFDPAQNVTVAQMLAAARSADGATFEGYKGGRYTMHLDTECYLCPYGEYRGDDDEMERHIERLLALRRAALASEVQAPSGEPWRPEVGERSDGPAVASERPGLARLLEWARAKMTEESAEMREYPERGRDAFEECVDEIEREIAALGPPSIAEDLRAPEPGAFEGAELVPAPLSVVLEDGRIVKASESPVGRSAVREALAELRPWFAARLATAQARTANADDMDVAGRWGAEAYTLERSIEEIDRMAER